MSPPASLLPPSPLPMVVPTSASASLPLLALSKSVPVVSPVSKLLGSEKHLIVSAHLFFLPHFGLKSLPGKEVELKPKKSGKDNHVKLSAGA